MSRLVLHPQGLDQWIDADRIISVSVHEGASVVDGPGWWLHATTDVLGGVRQPFPEAAVEQDLVVWSWHFASREGALAAAEKLGVDIGDLLERDRLAT
jgi:hypothetical protein